MKLVKENAKKTTGQMFCVECALVKKTLLERFNKKFKSCICKLVHFINLDMKEIFLLIGKMINAFIWKFPLKVEPTNYQTPDEEMTFGDFIIRYKHKFLRNIYTKEQIIFLALKICKVTAKRFKNLFILELV